MGYTDKSDYIYTSMKPYTKTGDNGQTSLASSQRVNKTCTRIEAYGTVDELNSQIGLLITYCISSHDIEILTEVQETLFVIGGILATDAPDSDKNCSVTSDTVLHLEQEIDAICSTLPPLKSFILPGGTRASAVSHICRTVCRRAERRILCLYEQEINVNPNLIAYINRLSDYLFVLARKLNLDENHPEIIWKKKK